MSEASSPPKLHVRYTSPDGKLTDLELSDKPITIGRSPDADIITLDERASRMHCGIRIWDGEYYIKDLKSKNGTFLNNQRVEMAKIKPGDKIRLGNTIIHVDDKKSPGTATTMDSVQNEMNEGKGYKTILREIVENTEKPAMKPAPAIAKPVTPAPSAEEQKTKTAKLVTTPQEESAPEAPAKAPAAKPAAPADGGTESKITIRKKPTTIQIKRS